MSVSLTMLDELVEALARRVADRAIGIVLADDRLTEVKGIYKASLLELIEGDRDVQRGITQMLVNDNTPMDTYVEKIADEQIGSADFTDESDMKRYLEENDYLTDDNLREIRRDVESLQEFTKGENEGFSEALEEALPEVLPDAFRKALAAGDIVLKFGPLTLDGTN